MKRTLLILIGILVGVFILLTALDMKGEYAAEKAIHKINKKFAKIKDDPLATPEARYAEVIGNYKKFIERFPDSRVTPFAHILIGRTYLLKKDYAMARSTFERVVQQYDDTPNLAAQGLLEMATTYSEEKDVSGVIRVYSKIMTDYPLTEQGLKAPLTLARIQSSESSSEQREAVYANTISHYRTLAQQHVQTPIGFKALHYVAVCQLDQQHWAAAVSAYSDILFSYSQPQYLNGVLAEIILRSINTISVGRLNDFDTPVRIYNQFIQQYPDHPLVPNLKLMIQGLENLKNQQMKKAATPS